MQRSWWQEGFRSVCMHVYECIYCVLYVVVCAHNCVCVFVCKRLCVCVYECACVRVCLPEAVCVCEWISVCLCTCACIRCACACGRATWDSREVSHPMCQRHWSLAWETPPTGPLSPPLPPAGIWWEPCQSSTMMEALGDVRTVGFLPPFDVPRRGDNAGDRAPAIWHQ